MDSQDTGVGAIHPDLRELLPDIQLTEAVVEGEVRSEEFVPRFSGMTKADYDKFIRRAAFFNLTERTLAAIVGALVRKPYTLTGTEPSFDDAFSLEDALINTYCKSLTTGRVGWLMDPTPDDPRRVVSYDSDDIMNWSDDFVVLNACRLVPDPNDKFTLINEERRLVLSLEDGIYTTQFWTLHGKVWMPSSEPITPLFRGKTLNFIPFIAFSPAALSPEPVKPPLNTMAQLNLQHFNTSLLIAHGSRFFALPKPWVSGTLSGVDASGNPPSTVTVGTEDVLLLNPGANVGYLEFSGSGGMGFLSAERTKLEEQMLMLGSRLLTEKAGVESVEAINLRLSTETASLMALIKVTEAALNTLLEWQATYIDGRAGSIVLNKDLALASIGTVADMPTIIELLTNGVIDTTKVRTEAERRGVLAPQVV